jgi:Na+-driven multidrug efflux pump
MGLFSSDAKILADGALYLAIVGLAYPFVAGTLLNSAFQSTRQPQWPLTAMSCRLAVVVLGGWIAVEVLHTGLTGIAVVTALGLVTMGGVLIGAFRFFAKLG